MGRIAVLAVGLLLLAGCSGSAEPPPPPPTTSHSSSPTPSPSASPTPPVMPEAAKAHTEAGAKAFVEYFWEVVNYAQATGDTTALGSLTLSDCTGCQAGINSINGVYNNGGRIRGGVVRPANIHATLGWSKKTAIADVVFEANVAPQVVILPSSRETAQARSSQDRFTLLSRSGGWVISDFRVAS